MIVVLQKGARYYAREEQVRSISHDTEEEEVEITFIDGSEVTLYEVIEVRFNDN